MHFNKDIEQNIISIWKVRETSTSMNAFLPKKIPQRRAKIDCSSCLIPCEILSLKIHTIPPGVKGAALR